MHDAPPEETLTPTGKFIFKKIPRSQTQYIFISGFCFPCLRCASLEQILSYLAQTFRMSRNRHCIYLSGGLLGLEFNSFYPTEDCYTAVCLRVCLRATPLPDLFKPHIQCVGKSVSHVFRRYQTIRDGKL